MLKYIVESTNPLCGEVSVSGSKNAALPIIAACILIDGVAELKNIPRLSDISLMCDILKCFGADVVFSANSLNINCTDLKNHIAPYDLAGKMRGSFLVMGPMLAKYKRARISLPGGCPIGARPVDLHLKGLSALGAKVTQGHGYVEVKAKKLTGARIYLDFPSVGATENIIMAAVLAEGTTTLANASQEPEIIDLANFLCKCGAKIYGIGTDEIQIEGTASLNPCSYTVISDRIEAGTFMTAAVITGGKICLKNVIPSHLSPVTAKLSELGGKISFSENSVTISASDKLRATDIKTMPYPGFPTDMQAVMMALLSVCSGTSVISETIFENRFMHASELCRMGASIKTCGRTAVIEGKHHLTGATVKVSDLRAGAALTIAALAARGKSEILDIYHIERGYDRFDEKLRSLGASIEKINM